MRLATAPAIAAAALCIAAAGQEPVGPIRIATGFLLRTNGVLAVGPVSAEIDHWDTSWKVAQQHDRFRRDPVPPPAPGVDPTAGPQVIRGVLATARGPARLVEQVTPAGGGLDYEARFSADRPIPTNELSLAFLLPVDGYAGDTIRVDGRPILLPGTPRARGHAVIFAARGVHRVTLRLLRRRAHRPGRTLVITGDFALGLQDDREWGVARYALRIHFTPDSGSITDSRIRLALRHAADG